MSRRPQGLDELQAIIRERSALNLRGGGTKSDGNIDVLDLTGLAGLVDYSPAECVLTARAGTRVRELVSALERHGQYLPFDPPFIAEGATLGGTVAAGVSGPRRYRYGGVRDFVIGMTVVDGAGRLIRSGGKVVKNAAGFLLHYAMVGSCGRFGAITEVTVKVFPVPESRRTIRAACATVERAYDVARRLEALRVDCESLDFDEAGTLTVGIAGRASAIEARTERLASAIRTGDVDVVATTAGRPSPTANHDADTRAASPATTGDEVVARVAGALRSWPRLQPFVRRAHFMCAGAVAWLTTGDPQSLDDRLRAERLTGQIIRGRGAGRRIGLVTHNDFEERVRRVLDPDNRFSAAPHTR